ncbi:MAG: triose-phosphate isomerase [Candidatus Margulisbacteria bacterium]|nr:triose-phosphate isomerase [Candidatus Margulisiibacteriota bacterium]MBU1022011.1 triose-phosphate isomerase [Candidatus Margulisiibacteriota bacterium]MBU1729866.1 triose-phosphate isomerase [Candidatus Margulisiibacteriota bacterium]MBU1955196.1 triose-phosphate isomerase [Candidatus Margulisiibacteriota bacterium]
MAKVSMTQVKKAWRRTAPRRGYNFGFNLKNLRATKASITDWINGASKNNVGSRDGLTVAAYFPPLYLAHVNQQAAGIFRGVIGAQEIHWAAPGSHTSGVHAESIAADFGNVRGVLINHSEVIGEHGRTLEQAAGQLRRALDTSRNSAAFQYITLCVGEDRATYDRGTTASVRYVKNQVRTMLQLAGVTAEEMSQVGIAYEPRFAIQVGDKPGIPPSDAHIAKMGWECLRATAEIVGIKAMAQMFTLQYGGSMKGPENEGAPVQRFVGPKNLVSLDLYNGGLIGTAGKDPVTAGAILAEIVPVA